MSTGTMAAIYPNNRNNINNNKEPKINLGDDDKCQKE
jgi:hypothetical protein